MKQVKTIKNRNWRKLYTTSFSKRKCLL